MNRLTAKWIRALLCFPSIVIAADDVKKLDVSAPATDLTPSWSSPEWFAMFNHSVTEARRLGMNIDLTPSSGWRLGGPHVTKKHSERSFSVKNGKSDVNSHDHRSFILKTM